METSTGKRIGEKKRKERSYILLCYFSRENIENSTQLGERERKEEHKGALHIQTNVRVRRLCCTVWTYTDELVESCPMSTNNK